MTHYDQLFDKVKRHESITTKKLFTGVLFGGTLTVPSFAAEQVDSGGRTQYV
ncbi:exported hypothetical protein [Xenorhabdus bovienii str. feltiae Moldova]|uniref:Uncharacterized protein n=1 Tax=Xenorhabdus bovienii str. feltiae Moldova TaxID=1398200 RepID=A0A077NSH6_XENBV|nr:exported hypothetical protein [Xenorhabdus bovienii str. feltiae Moldova]